MEADIRSNISFRNNVYSRLGLYLLLGLGLIVLLIMPFSISGDGAIRFEFMDALVHKMQITPMRYSFIGPIFSLPLWLLASLAKNPISIVARYNFLLYVLSIFILYQWLKPHFERKFLITFLFVLSFGSMFPGHLLDYYGEVFSAMFLALGMIGLAKKDRIAWACMILAVLNTPALLVPFLFIVGYYTWTSKQLRYLTLVFICLLLIFLESRIRMGSYTAVFQTYLARDSGQKTLLPYSGIRGFSYPFHLGILSILLSFGKGLIFSAPDYY